MSTRTDARLLDDRKEVLQREALVEQQPHRRQLDRNVRIDAGGADRIEHFEVNLALTQGGATLEHVFAQVIERCRHAAGIELAYDANGGVDGFARNETPREKVKILLKHWGLKHGLYCTTPRRRIQAPASTIAASTTKP
jgi:hypothetical protein